MIGAAKRKSISPPGLTALWTILLLVVTLCLGQTRVWGFEITPQPASGVFAPANPLSIGENYDGWQYDASDSLLAAKGASGLANEIGIMRAAAAGKGNFGLGSASASDAMRLGRSWVGDGYKVASDGKTLISSDGLRQFRPPSVKPTLNKTQANFEQRWEPSGQWQGNGHLDIP